MRGKARAIIPPTPDGKLREWLLYDLSPARRRLARIERGTLQPTPEVLAEIAASIERCAARIERDVQRPLEPKP